MSSLKNLNENHFTSSICKGITTILLLGISILGIKELIQRGDDLTSIIVRSLAALSLYGQSEIYRRKVLMLLPPRDVIRYSTVISGVILAYLTIRITVENSTWLLLFGFMMCVICSLNTVIYFILSFTDDKHPLRSTFGKWSLAALGYSVIIFFVTPLIYTLKKISPSSIVEPIMDSTLSPMYIDLAPAILLGIGMLMSIIRLEKNFDDSNMEKECEKYYQKSREQ